MVRSERRRLASIGSGKVGVVGVDAAAGGEEPPVGAAVGPLPLVLVTWSRAREPAEPELRSIVLGVRICASVVEQ